LPLSVFELNQYSWPLLQKKMLNSINYQKKAQAMGSHEVSRTGIWLQRHSHA
jgi:hypothetical protein